MSLPFLILLPELDPLLPRERHTRKEQTACIDHPSFDCLAVFAAWPELLVAVAEVVSDRLAVAPIHPNNELMIRDVVAGNVRRQERNQLLADDINSGNFVDASQRGREDLRVRSRQVLQPACFLQAAQEPAETLLKC